MTISNSARCTSESALTPQSVRRRSELSPQLEFGIFNSQGAHARGAGKVSGHAIGHGSSYAVERALFWSGKGATLAGIGETPTAHAADTRQGCHPSAPSLEAKRQSCRYRSMRVEFPSGRVAETRSISRRVRTPRDAYDGYLATRQGSSAYSACSLAILHSNSLPAPRMQLE